MTFAGEWQSYALLFFAAVLPNEVWRIMGLLVGRRVDEGSEVLIWVRTVATAILAGVIAQILLVPPGALATIPLALRLGATALGFVAYLVAGRSLLAGVVCGELALVAGQILL